MRSAGEFGRVHHSSRSRRRGRIVVSGDRVGKAPAKHEASLRKDLAGEVIKDEFDRLYEKKVDLKNGKKNFNLGVLDTSDVMKLLRDCRENLHMISGPGDERKVDQCIADAAAGRRTAPWTGEAEADSAVDAEDEYFGSVSDGEGEDGTDAASEMTDFKSRAGETELLAGKVRHRVSRPRPRLAPVASPSGAAAAASGRRAAVYRAMDEYSPPADSVAGGAGAESTVTLSDMTQFTEQPPAVVPQPVETEYGSESGSETEFTGAYAPSEVGFGASTLVSGTSGESAVVRRQKALEEDSEREESDSEEEVVSDDGLYPVE